jgi:bacterioferritin
MKGNDKIRTVLNSFLADELTVINQYMVHSEMENFLINQTKGVVS